MSKNEEVWLIVGGVVIVALLVWKQQQMSAITQTSTGAPIAGPGVDLFDASAYTVADVFAAGGL